MGILYLQIQYPVEESPYLVIEKNSEFRTRVRFIRRVQLAHEGWFLGHDENGLIESP